MNVEPTKSWLANYDGEGKYKIEPTKSWLANYDQAWLNINAVARFNLNINTVARSQLQLMIMMETEEFN